MPSHARLTQAKARDLQKAASSTMTLDALFNRNRQTSSNSPSESESTESQGNLINLQQIADGDHQKPEPCRRKTKVATLISWGYSWLGYEMQDDFVSQVWCKTCREACNKKDFKGAQYPWVDADAYLKGTQNVKKDTARCHEKSNFHLSAAKAIMPREDSVLVQQLFKLDEKTNNRLCKLFDWAYTLAFTEQAFTVFPTLVEVEKKHGSDIGDTYVNDKGCRSFVDSIGETMKLDLLELFSREPFYCSIIFDGSSDKKFSEKEVVSIQLLEKGKVKVKLLSITEPTRCDAEGIEAAIRKSCDAANLSLSDSCVAVAADGASVNFGKHKGVLSRLQQSIPWLLKIHCVAHRLELALKDAFKDSYYLQIDEFMMNIYYMYKRSAKKFQELKNVGEALGEYILKPVRAQGTRWLDHRRKALHVLKRNYASLVTQMTEIASGLRKDFPADDQAKMKGYLKLLTSHKFVLYMASYLDIVEDLAELSLILQTDGISLGRVRMMLQVTQARLTAQFRNPGDTLREIQAQATEATGWEYRGVKLNSSQRQVAEFSAGREQLMEKIVNCMTDRFANFTEDPVFQAADILDPSNYPADQGALVTYGIEHIDALKDHFQDLLEKKGCITDSIHREWTALKFYVQRHHGTETVGKLWEKIIQEKELLFPNILHLIKILLVCPASSAHVERQFSFMKRCLGDWRLKLNTGTLEHLLRISSEGPSPATFNPQPAVNHWQKSAVRKRRTNISPYGPRKKPLTNTEYTVTEETIYPITSDSEESSILTDSEQ